jgi:hypothetical protein
MQLSSFGTGAFRRKAAMVAVENEGDENASLYPD